MKIFTLYHTKIVAFALLSILALDAVTKYLTVSYLPEMGSQWPIYPYGGIGIFENFLGVEFSITHATNRGAAWGAFADYQYPLLWLRCGLIAAMGGYLCFFNRNRLYELPFILIIAGAIGNVIDNFFYGQVIDMFHFVFWGYDYPVFNVADSAICIGIGSLFLLTLICKERPLDLPSE